MPIQASAWLDRSIARLQLKCKALHWMLLHSEHKEHWAVTMQCAAISFQRKTEKNSSQSAPLRCTVVRPMQLKINRKMENSTPCKIVTHENLNMKIGRHDYVVDVTHNANFGWIRFSGGFSPNRWNITLLWLFWLSCFFSIHTGQTVRPIFTLHGSNDVHPRKDGPYGG